MGCSVYLSVKVFLLLGYYNHFVLGSFIFYFSVYRCHVDVYSIAAGWLVLVLVTMLWLLSLAA